MDCVADISPERKHTKAFVIEDVRIATAELRHRGYVCDRITHVELMSFVGSQYLGNLLAGDYHLLWVATPSDWTIHTPGKRAGPHYQRIQNLMVKARALRMQITLMGPPSYFWKLAPIKVICIRNARALTIRF